MTNWYQSTTISAMAKENRTATLEGLRRKAEAQLQEMQKSSEYWERHMRVQENIRKSEALLQEMRKFQFEDAPIKASSQEIDSNPQFPGDPNEFQFRLEFLETCVDNEVLEFAKTDQGIEEPKVILNPLGESGDVSIDSVKVRDPDFRRIAMDCLATPTVQQFFMELPVRLIDFGMISIEFFEISCAPKVFVEMSSRVESSFAPVATIVKHRVLDGNVIFDPGIDEICVGLSNFFKVVVHTNLKKDGELSRLGLNGFDSSLIANARCCCLRRVNGIEVVFIRFENELFLQCLGASIDSWTYVNIRDEGYCCYLELTRYDKISFPYDRGRVCVAQVEKLGLPVTVFDPGGGYVVLWVCCWKLIRDRRIHHHTCILNFDPRGRTCFNELFLQDHEVVTDESQGRKVVVIVVEVNCTVGPSVSKLEGYAMAHVPTLFTSSSTYWPVEQQHLRGKSINQAM